MENLGCNFVYRSISAILLDSRDEAVVTAKYHGNEDNRDRNYENGNGGI
jgi:hypothetical protein